MSIDWAVVRKVLTGLREGLYHTVDSEEIGTSPERFPFTKEEFRDVFQWIETDAEKRGAIDEQPEHHFPEAFAHFTFEGHQYVWHHLAGQGSVSALYFDPVGDMFDRGMAFALEKAEALPQPAGYHVNKIKKGKLGEWSKVLEEFQECEDAIQQDVKVMLLVELSDLIGAVEAYVKKQHNMTLQDLLKMAEVTRRAFESGRRS